MADAQITLRVDSALKDEAQKIVDEGKYHNLTDFIQKAMREKIARDRVDEKERFKQAMIDLIHSDPDIQKEIEGIAIKTTLIFGRSGDGGFSDPWKSQNEAE